MTLLATLETYVFNLEQRIQQLQQENQILQETIQKQTKEQHDLEDK
jgi:predicted nuclease with TOPRIM domain